MNKKLIVILGPTASGKTEMAMRLSKKFKGEIVSADSRQIYKEMNIGTAKPKKTFGIPHHLIDIIKLDQEFNAAIYKKLATKTIKDIQKRGKIPFLVGGTGLYIWTIVDNLKFSGISAQKELRRDLEKKSAKELFRFYKKLDPKGAKFIDKNNKRRLIRAIEVCKVTGKSFWQERKSEKPIFDTLQIGIKIEKRILEKRIEKRINQMIKMGLEKEAKTLFKKYGNVPTLCTIGYQEWFEFFEKKIDKETVKKEILKHTLSYAKRQMTWFRRDKRIVWLKDYKRIVELIKNFLKSEKIKSSKNNQSS